MYVFSLLNRGKDTRDNQLLGVDKMLSFFEIGGGERQNKNLKYGATVKYVCGIVFGKEGGAVNQSESHKTCLPASTTPFLHTMGKEA